MKKSLILIFCINAFGYNQPFHYDPFVKFIPNDIKNLQSSQTTSSSPYRLTAVMSNRAFINGKWYSLGDKINSYTIRLIKPYMVKLAKGSKILILPMDKKKKILKIRNKK